MPLARKGGLYLNICAGVPEFLVTPLLMRPVRLYVATAGLKSPSAPGRSYSKIGVVAPTSRRPLNQRVRYKPRSL